MTADIEIAPHAIRALDACLMRHAIGARLVLVYDTQTQAAAGGAVESALSAHWQSRTCILPHPHASLAQAQTIIAQATQADAILAIGSGTINDLSKYAAHTLGIPYIAIATAASMNGYVSATASLKDGAGQKHSFPVRAPIALIADLDILMAAPARLARAGLADTLCRTTVESDMILSHFVRNTPYPLAIFERLRRHESALLDALAQHPLTHPTTLARLMDALIAGGEAMAEYGTSAVASQGEHMIAHTLEMLAPDITAPLLHGELIAATSVTMDRLQRTRITKLSDDIQQAIRAIQLPENMLATTLTGAGLVLEPLALGIPATRYAEAIAIAPTTRDRLTFLSIN